MTLGQVRLYLEADDRRQRRERRQRLIDARAVWLAADDFKQLLQDLD